VSSEPTKRGGFFGRLFGKDASTKDEAVAPLRPDAVSVDRAAEPELQDSDAAALQVSEAQPVDTQPPEEISEAPRKSWFQRLKSGLSQTSAKLTEGITSVFTKRRLDATTLDDLEDLLLQADLGLATSERIAATLKATRYEKSVLAAEVERVLTPVAKPLVLRDDKQPHVMLFVGVNGTGKTTTIGKLAAKYRRDGKSVMIAAGDTFRAAAVEQLKVWGERAGAKVIARATGADAAGLAFEALEDARKTGVDVLLIDTAGRLQNKAVLMDELEKVVRVMRKVDPTAPHDVVLVLDATTGQNALNQVEVFKDRAGVTGLVMTKLDGTARGGILVAISAKFGLPVHAVGVGEGIDDLEPFDAGEFARAIALS
jgi:fused signal recognition particle receptor